VKNVVMPVVIIVERLIIGHINPGGVLVIRKMKKEKPVVVWVSKEKADYHKVEG
jgi:hypothetical protein